MAQSHAGRELFRSQIDDVLKTLLLKIQHLTEVKESWTVSRQENLHASIKVKVGTSLTLNRLNNI